MILFANTSLSVDISHGTFEVVRSKMFLNDSLLTLRNYKRKKVQKRRESIKCYLIFSPIRSTKNILVCTREIRKFVTVHWVFGDEKPYLRPCTPFSLLERFNEKPDQKVRKRTHFKRMKNEAP